ncbi:hypothetical protein K9L63_01780 [Candidatus Gracilibacteria bacterium]|nr:hypothetical protein [Candidatus Gracilibacteria bacterium]
MKPLSPETPSTHDDDTLNGEGFDENPNVGKVLKLTGGRVIEITAEDPSDTTREALNRSYQ